PCFTARIPVWTSYKTAQEAEGSDSEAFPVDQVDGNFVRAVRNCVFSKSIPTPLKGPLRLAAVSKDVIEGILDLDAAVTQSEDFLLYVSGARLMPGSVPLAHRYGGHQFGYWAGQLGDGRAHFLGQYTNRKGEIWDLQLKGSGKTPYSRSGDGRAVIRSSVREFLCSEAMHSLGVPTSRAASLVVSKEPVLRDQFYNGNVKTERGAVVLRLAKSWFRIGSLEILSRTGEIDLLRKLLNFVIEEHFPSISSDDPDKYLVLYATIVNETAHLIASWMSVGFAHGVCNTDNFSLLSITIDYGPFGFMESYDPNFVPNTSDDEGRYSIGAQANVGLFNLEKLLEALSPMMEDTQSDFTMTFRQLSEASAQQLRLQIYKRLICVHSYFFIFTNLPTDVNPRYVLRNWMAESAVRKAEVDDFSEVELLHRVLSVPFVTQETAEEAGYAARPPSWAKRLKVSCSS
uniref:Selenoprotein O n=1 Tax=Myripristis murdjan TaxID=586833 RepID=A0A667YX21_9TELE